jgi:hypothetical protein
MEMNIGNIVSTVQSEPLELPLGEEVFTSEDVRSVMADSRESYLNRYEVLVNDEITPEIREDIFA